MIKATLLLSPIGPHQVCTRRATVCTILGMTSMTISAARQNLPDAVDKARTEPVILERYGRPAAVLISPEHYARLVAALEDAEDAEAFDAAMAEEGPNIPWDQAKADLGWE
jgi:antitoxin Phd